jgi:hypothetical protein
LSQKNQFCLRKISFFLKKISFFLKKIVYGVNLAMFWIFFVTNSVSWAILSLLDFRARFWYRLVEWASGFPGVRFGAKLEVWVEFKGRSIEVAVGVNGFRVVCFVL